MYSLSQKLKWIWSTSTSLTNPVPVFPGPKLSPSSRASSDLQKHILPHTAATATWAVHQVQLCLLSVEYSTCDGVHTATTKATLQEMDKNIMSDCGEHFLTPVRQFDFAGLKPLTSKNNPLPFQMQIQCQASRIN